MPSTTYGRMVLFESEVDAGQATIHLEQTGDVPAQLKVSQTPKENADEAVSIRFIQEENGETVVSVAGAEKGYARCYLVKILWKDAQGAVKGQYIAKIY